MFCIQKGSWKKTKKKKKKQIIGNDVDEQAPSSTGAVLLAWCLFNVYNLFNIQIICFLREELLKETLQQWSVTKKIKIYLLPRK